jgi:4-amino-4-deoxy-L-arabinose transferase-like glycosyltransferase
VDEATTGYNAYSILKTGKDEYGKSFPILMRFMGSYSPSLYTYLSVIPIYSLGLSAFSVRVVSAVCGVLSIFVFYLILRESEIFKNRYIEVLGTLFFAVSPWTVFYARVGYEIYLGFLLFMVGVYFCLRGLKNPKGVIWGFLVLSLSSYGAHTERFLVSLFGVLYVVVFWRKLLVKKTRIFLVMGIIAGLLVQVPHLTLINTDALMSKNSLFYGDVVVRQAEKIRYLPDVISYPLSFLREYFSQFVSYFSPKNLFFFGESDLQRSIPCLSVFYPWMIVLYVAGFWRVYKNKGSDFSKFLVILLFCTPAVVSLTATPFSTQRALPHLLPLGVVLTFGVDEILGKVSKSVFVVGVVVFLTYSFLFLWRGYFVLLPNLRANAWGWGVEKLVEEIEKNPQKHWVVDQSRKKPLYIQIAFYQKYSPQKIQEGVGEKIAKNYYNLVDFESEKIMGNVEIRNINWEEDPCKDQILVGDEFAVSPGQAQEHGLKKIFEIRNFLGEIVFVGHETSLKKCE